MFDRGGLPAERLTLPVLLLALVLTLGVLAVLPTSAQEAGATQEPPAQLGVSPGKFEIDIDAGPAVHSLRLMNFGDRDVDVRVSVVAWDLDDGNRVRELEPSERTMDQWIVFSPGSFTLPARGEQTVRFSVRPRVRPHPGEHRAMLYFEEVPRGAPAAGQMRVRFKLGVAIYGHAGAIERAGALHGLRIDSGPQALNVAFDVGSTGNAHVRLAGQYAVWPLESFPGIDAVAPLVGLGRDDFQPPAPILLAGLLPSTPVLGGTRRDLFLSGGHTLPPGRYVLVALGRVGQQAFREAVEFVVPPRVPTQIAARQQDDGGP